MLYTDNCSKVLEGAKLAEIQIGDEVRGVIDDRPMSGRSCWVTAVDHGTARPKRAARRIAVVTVHFYYPNGSEGFRVFPADRVVAIVR